MKVINLFGCPGAGKSTAAAYIFYRLKDAGLNCELCTEYAKDMVFDKNTIALKNQLYIAGNQSYRLDRLRNSGVQVVVTDAPLMLQTVYYRRNNCPEPDMFEIIINNVNNDFDNMNYLLPVPDEVSSIGRIHDINDSYEIHRQIVDLFNRYNMSYTNIGTDISYYDRIADFAIISCGRSTPPILESDGVKSENY